jgi:hypothetical protein
MTPQNLFTHVTNYRFIICGTSFKYSLAYWNLSMAIVGLPPIFNYNFWCDRLCGRVVRVLGYRSGGPGSIPGHYQKIKVVGLERGPLNLASTSEEILDRIVAVPV